MVGDKWIEMRQNGAFPFPRWIIVNNGRICGCTTISVGGGGNLFHDNYSMWALLCL